MRFPLCGPAILLAAMSLPAPAQDRASKRRAEAEKVDRPIPYAVPAREMERLGLFLGRWTGKETWEEPLRYKRPRYEGYPGVRISHADGRGGARRFLPPLEDRWTGDALPSADGGGTGRYGIHRDADATEPGRPEQRVVTARFEKTP